MCSSHSKNGYRCARALRTWLLIIQTNWMARDAWEPKLSWCTLYQIPEHMSRTDPNLRAMCMLWSFIYVLLNGTHTLNAERSTLNDWTFLCMWSAFWLQYIYVNWLDSFVILTHLMPLYGTFAIGIMKSVFVYLFCICIVIRFAKCKEKTVFTEAESLHIPYIHICRFLKINTQQK